MLTVRQAARALLLGEQAVYDMINADPPLILATRAGRLIRIPRRRFIEQFHIPEDHDFGDP